MTWHLDIQLELEHLSLTVNVDLQTQVIALIGENGSGKSTLLKAVAGAYQHLRGQMEVGGVTFCQSNSAFHLPIESRNIGYVPQGNRLMPHLSVLENVCFGPIPNHLDRHRYLRTGMDLLKQFDCVQLAHCSAALLSTGQAQRVALARALVRDPAVLLLDEPLSNIDPVTRLELRRLLASYLSTTHTPTLIATHDYRQVLNLAQTVCVMEAGRIIQVDTPLAVVANPSNAFTEAFFDGFTQTQP